MRTQNIQIILGAFGGPKSSPQLPYGLNPMYKTVVAEDKVTAPITPINDRIANAKAMVIGFAAEHSLSFSLVPNIIELAKALANDGITLDSLSMTRTTASYLTRYGVGKTFEHYVVEMMKHTKFSLNMDKSTSNNFQRVLTILVSFYCPVMKQVKVCHFGSLSCVKVDSATLFGEVVHLMERNEIPWNNMMSILMDSCNVMRGSKSGLETRIHREKAPHLLDIDGDVCHHVHNAAKAFCKPFNNFIEQLYIDLFNDFKWSADLRELLQEICVICNVKYTMAQRYISHRWLSVYDVTLDALRLLDCLTLFYFLWISDSLSERAKYLPVTAKIIQRLDVSESSRNRLHEIRRVTT